MPARKYAEELCGLYEALNRRDLVHPDPLEFLYGYEDVRDREIVGLVASSLAYGNVNQILKSVASILAYMPHPHRFLMESSRTSLLHTFHLFKHRFTTGQELATMLFGAREAIEHFGSLRQCLAHGMKQNHETIVPALSFLVGELSRVFDGKPRSLLPSPERGSAVKRLNLFLRWMVRHDAVDPGGWDTVSPSKLVVPLDTHMHRICLQLGLTTRKQADLRAALEITEAFRAVSPDDPVRFDFCLTRLGIRRDMNPQCFIELCRHACR